MRSLIFILLISSVIVTCQNVHKRETDDIVEGEIYYWETGAPKYTMDFSTWKGKSSLADSWPLMRTPYPLIAIMALYLMIVYKFGPKFMENRKAFQLNNATRLYNLYQIMACTYFVMNAAHGIGFSWNVYWKCLPVPEAKGEPTEKMIRFLNWYWYFFMLRLSEFSETIVFVLRKKQNQVSFLHVYHHIAVVAIVWIFLKYSDGISGNSISVLNSAVHMLMYSYYFLSSFDTFKRGGISKVKPMITAIQIVQLVILFAHCLFVLSVCNASNLFYLQAVNLGFLVLMFLKFYFKSYSKVQSAIKKEA